MKHKVYIEDLPTSALDTPVLDYCRTLIRQGHDPSDSLEAWRRRTTRDILCLKIKSIGQAAMLTVSEEAMDFVPYTGKKVT